MKLYLTRHGESEANILHVISNRNLPHSLTPKGRLQANALAERLRGKSLLRIWSSPILRARETAEILSSRLGIPLECVDALREPDCGELEGRGDDAAWDELEYWNKNWSFGRLVDNGPRGGETYVEIRQRFFEFITELINRFGETEYEFVLVTHGALIRYGLPGIITDMDPQFLQDYDIGYASLIMIEINCGKLACIKWEPE